MCIRDSPYTNTISARYYKDGSEILIEQKGSNPRKITPREASRLQGFPSDFIIPVSDTQAYTPVSYTHLDVYKRQLISNLGIQSQSLLSMQ